MSRPPDLNERIGLWQRAFEAVRYEVVTPATRAMLSAMDGESGMRELGSYMSLARNVMAGDRTAALVASMLVSGVRTLPTDDLNELG